jgi:hypothetical protein
VESHGKQKAGTGEEKDLLGRAAAGSGDEEERKNAVHPDPSFIDSDSNRYHHGSTLRLFLFGLSV